jgi:hypothetical protein
MWQYGAVGMLGLAGLAALDPALSWVYIAAFGIFEMWLARRVASAGRVPVPVEQAPYHFTAEEAAFVGRYRFYFAFPAIARQAASVLAALGLTALVLAPWLTFRSAFVQAVLIGLNLFLVARFTKQLAPLMVLRVAASKGDRAALRMLELHDPLWAKIRAANAQAAEGMATKNRTNVT